MRVDSASPRLWTERKVGMASMKLFGGGPGRALMLVALLLPMLGGCSSDKDTYVERPPEDLYNQALTEMAAGDHLKAAKTFDEVDRQHPYSSWATQAQLMSAYA